MKQNKSKTLFISHVKALVYKILWVMLCLTAWGSQAEPASYKKIALNNVNNIYTQGFFKVEIKQGEEESLDLYIRDSQINTVKIGVEEIKSSDGTPNSRALFVKQLDNSSEGKRDEAPIANLIITVKNLRSLKVHDTYQVLVANIESNGLKLEATGRSDVYLDKVKIKNGSFVINHESILKVNDSRIEQLILNQYSVSKIGINGLLTNTMKLDLRDRSYFSAKNFTASSVHSFGTFKSHLFIKENSDIASIFIAGNRWHKVEASGASLKVVNCDITENAVANLPTPDILTVKASGDSKVYYQGSSTLSVDQKDNAIIKKVLSTSPSHHHE
ncbi:DUF2807 domain-containing protein [Colwellia sp. E2M01]|uniref:GIN domain-containing protein n=1 Tax=Colwellia sp. E2M01 TaxID=2841561 RepID=UPI001C08C93B|nr:DUF2807 domain-containing protein [Colwellia sp. E2M01]MBU2869443.1 DUF2807 domain-containing protein [Colwellia sp. E2M01]